MTVKSRKSDVSRLRTWSRVLLMLLVAVHIVSWYVLGVHAVGSIGIEALFVGLSKGVLNAGFVFWMLVFVSALLLGRAFCGWFCWFGGYQEVVEWGVGRFNLQVPRRILLYVGFIPFVGLGLKVYSTWLTHWLDGVPSTFVFRLSHTEPWGGQQTGVSIVITLIVYGPVLMYVFGRRAWCRYLCPIGALLKVFSKVGLAKVRLVSDECIACGKCNRDCSMQIDVMGELDAYGEVRDLNCIRCLKCTSNCPQDAIAFGFNREPVSLKPKVADWVRQVSLKRRGASAFDVGIVVLWSSIVLFVFVAGMRQNAPQEIKSLMTPGLLLVVYGLMSGVRKVWNRSRAQVK